MKTQKKSNQIIAALLLVTFMSVFTGCVMFRAGDASPRHIINLDGTWEIAEGSMDSVPERFTHNVPVPGLVDMAKPAFAEVGTKNDKRQAFWYRRTFTVNGTVPSNLTWSRNRLRTDKELCGQQSWTRDSIV